MSHAFSVISVHESVTSKMCSNLSSGTHDPRRLDVTVCCWVKGSYHFKGLCINLNSFETSDSPHPITQHHIPEELIFMDVSTMRRGGLVRLFCVKTVIPVTHVVHSAGILFVLDCVTWWNCTIEMKIAVCMAIWMHTVRAVVQSLTC
jgi:hypothetical protein